MWTKSRYTVYSIVLLYTYFWPTLYIEYTNVSVYNTSIYKLLCYGLTSLCILCRHGYVLITGSIDLLIYEGKRLQNV